MKREIRQNERTVLYGEDGHSIPMIFNNLVGKNLKGREYCKHSINSPFHSKNVILLL